MPKFKYQIDEKCTVWQRHTYTVEATTKQEAEALMAEELEYMNLPDSGAVKFEECETLFETIEYILPSENDGQCTRELMNDEGETILTNAENA